MQRVEFDTYFLFEKWLNRDFAKSTVTPLYAVYAEK